MSGQHGSMFDGALPVAVKILFGSVLVASTQVTSPKSDEVLKPNYGNTMLSPVEGSEIKPRLCAARSKFPLRVVVLNSFYFTDGYFSAIKQACEAWSIATKGVSGGGVTLTCVDSDDIKGADVVFMICTREKVGGFSGFTTELGAGAVIQLSAFDSDGHRVTSQSLKRVAMHEFGHSLGIWGHSPDPNDTMSLSEKATSVSQADVNTLRTAYSGRGLAIKQRSGYWIFEKGS